MIVAFTKDWDDVPTCTTHILREMAKTIPVLWVSSIGTRKPSATSGKDVRRIIGRIVSGLKPAEWKENNLWVLKPILIPKAESSFAKWINRKIFGWYVRRERRGESGEGREALSSKSSDLCSLEYWCFVPNAVDLIPLESGIGLKGETIATCNDCNVQRLQHTKDAKIVYYCADDWTQFHNLDGEWMKAKENELVQRADVVFVTSRFLENKLAPLISPQKLSALSSKLSASHSPLSALSSKLIYMPHGVEYNRFATALDKTLPVPEDVADISKPVVGFYGNLHPWVDFGLIRSLAVARPKWSFVLIGEKYADLSELEALPNVFMLGRRDHGMLHDYCRAFDLSIIPYDMTNPRMESVNPVKTKEILAAGIPVVASDVPELRNYGDDVIACCGVDEWLVAMDRQIVRNDQNEISARVREESWANKVVKIRELVDAI